MVSALRSFGAAALLLLIGCAGPKHANWPDIPEVVTLYVKANGDDIKKDEGNIAAMLDVIETEFREDGRRVEVVVARDDERAPVPRLELQVLGADSGDAEMRKQGHVVGQVVSQVIGDTMLIAGSGSIVVDAFIVRGGGRKPVYLGRFSAGSMTSLSDEQVAAGESTGHIIAKMALK
jgi:hypothetical protein